MPSIVKSYFNMLIRCVKILLVFCVVVVHTTISLYAQDIDGRELDIKIYFSYDQVQIDPTYMDNHASLHLIDSLLRDTHYISTLSNIEITAQSSPEGRVHYNERLSERRKRSLEQYFRTSYPQIDPSLWSFKAVAENWDLFREHLMEDKNLPSRDEILAIVDGNRAPDDKEWLLKKMDGGRPWLYIKEHILPTQRFGASVLFIPIVETPVEHIEPTPAIEETLTIVQDSILQLPILPDSVQVVHEVESPKVLFALKTNLVLDLLSVVNLAAEIPIGRRWSIVGEVVYPWWRSWPDDFTMQIESYHGELKYWLGDRELQEQLQGWYLGAYGGWGRYDIQPFTATGVQGTFFDSGLEVGYAHPIARNLHLEYTIGLGYVSTSYDNYKMVSDTDEYGDIKVIPYPWLNNSLKSILPTRCGVSLVWTIKNGGGQR